ncbi:MAG: CBS domain-containing protein [Candidatus Dadabacteria bacterium]|nr:MAG: CBS domain-containing protein [Candidatus Dadabacteria bacterium]
MNLPDLRSILHRKFIASKVSLLSLHDPIYVSPKASIAECVKKLREKNIGCLLIMENGNLNGIISERDILRQGALLGAQCVRLAAAEIMTRDVKTIKSNASIARLLHMFAVNGFRHAPVICEDGIKVISVKDFVDFIYLELTKKLTEKFPVEVVEYSKVDAFFAQTVSVLEPAAPVVVPELEPIREALRRINDNSVGAVIVIDHDQRIRGIFTERDYIKKIACTDTDIETTPVKKVMTESPATAQLTTSVAYAFNLMSEGKYRHVPVVDTEEDLVGIVSVKNFINYLASGILEELEKYK